MNKCEVCGYLHYRTDPCRSAKQSTAARMDVHIAPAGAGSAKDRVRAPDGQPDEVAGTQALPVDTPPKRGRGRPKSITDMREYKAAKARGYRAARSKAKREAGK